MFAHTNWVKAGLLEKLKKLASRRSLHDLTIGPVLTVTNERFDLLKCFFQFIITNDTIKTGF